MAKLSAHGKEVGRILSVNNRALLAFCEDGVTLARTPFHGWKVHAKKKKEVPLETWLAQKREYLRTNLEKCPWKGIDRIPTAEQLRRWDDDGICGTPTGERVEPDGRGTDGVPSWLIIFGLI